MTGSVGGCGPVLHLDLAIPELRKGIFFPSLLERRRRIDHARGWATAASR